MKRREKENHNFQMKVIDLKWDAYFPLVHIVLTQTSLLVLMTVV